MARTEGKLTARERRIWRSGLLRGAELAVEAMVQFRDRVQFRGVEADPPEAFGDQHPLEQLVRPQLKRRRSA